jgi:predicted PurR-regulated permease PerM
MPIHYFYSAVVVMIGCFTCTTAPFVFKIKYYMALLQLMFLGRIQLSQDYALYPLIYAHTAKINMTYSLCSVL